MTAWNGQNALQQLKDYQFAQTLNKQNREQAFKNALSGNTSDSGVKESALNLNTGKQTTLKKGGAIKKAKPKCMARGGGCEVRGKTKGRFV